MFEIYIMVWLEKEMEGNWEDIEIHKTEKGDERWTKKQIKKQSRLQQT